MLFFLVDSKCPGLTVLTLVSENTTGDARGCRRRFLIEVGGLEVWDNVSWTQGLSAPGETELVQHGAGGDEPGNTGQIHQAEHTGHLEIESIRIYNTPETSQAYISSIAALKQTPSHLGEVLADGCEGLAPG